MQIIEILNQDHDVIANIVTGRPQWSFDQYCRNRETVGWSWRIAKLEGISATAAI